MLRCCSLSETVSISFVQMDIPKPTVYCTFAKCILVAVALSLYLASCKPDKIEPSQEYIGPTDSLNYLGGAATNLSPDVHYLNTWTQATSDVNQLHSSLEAHFIENYFPEGQGDPSGLGPLFNHFSCVGCHNGGGRSHAPLSEIDPTSGTLLRFSLPGQTWNGSPLPVPGFGTQLQHRSASGVPEGNYVMHYADISSVYPSGEEVILHQPYFDLVNLYTTMPSGVLFTLRNASPIYGLGLLEAIPEETILALADEGDADGDYISGKPNYAYDIRSKSMKLARFGWKSSHVTLEDQIAAALHEDMGVTSNVFFPLENCLGQSNCEATDSLPDITESRVTDIATYLRTLAVPMGRMNRETHQRGMELFTELYCDRCHTPQLYTGQGYFGKLSNQKIHPYTDLLLHDMGEGLADGRPDYAASTNEWRTPPLWGIGLTQIVYPQARFLHDGRAETIEEAILWHGGEAYWSKEAFRNLSPADRKSLIDFVRAL